MDFEWDEQKANANTFKHGVTFEEAKKESVKNMNEKPTLDNDDLLPEYEIDYSKAMPNLLPPA